MTSCPVRSTMTRSDSAGDRRHHALLELRSGEEVDLAVDRHHVDGGVDARSSIAKSMAIVFQVPPRERLHTGLRRRRAGRGGTRGCPRTRCPAGRRAARSRCPRRARRRRRPGRRPPPRRSGPTRRSIERSPDWSATSTVAAPREPARGRRPGRRRAPRRRGGRAAGPRGRRASRPPGAAPGRPAGRPRSTPRVGVLRSVHEALMAGSRRVRMNDITQPAPRGRRLARSRTSRRALRSG